MAQPPSRSSLTSLAANPSHRSLWPRRGVRQRTTPAQSDHRWTLWTTIEELGDRSSLGRTSLGDVGSLHSCHQSRCGTRGHNNAQTEGFQLSSASKGVLSLSGKAKNADHDPAMDWRLLAPLMQQRCMPCSRLKRRNLEMEQHSAGHLLSVRYKVRKGDCVHTYVWVHA